MLVMPALKAQTPNLQADIDSVTLPIGQQTLLHLTLTGSSDQRYTFPTFPGDQVVDGVEVLDRRPVDTLELDGSYIKLKADYLITSFDSGLYYIPPIKVLAGTDSVFSNELALNILTYDVDTTNYQLFDIKGIQKPPFVLADYLWLFLLVFGATALGVGGWWYFKRYKQRLSTPTEADVLASLPPHVAAFKALDTLKQERPWLYGRNKEYYTRLSDILRLYIERRFQVNAPEMTTSEILDLFRRDKLTQSVYQNLKQILQLSDLVKFAKLGPQESEHELSLMNAYLFVNQTKIEERPDPEAQKEALEGQTNEDTSSLHGVFTPSDDPSMEEETLKKYQPK